VARASRSQGLKHKYYCGSVRFNVRMFWADHRRVLPLHYTFGPALRILHVKNMGKDLALEELRICP